VSEADDAFDRFVFDGLAEPYMQQSEPMTLAELTALLGSFERHKRRLIVPTARVEEFETAVRAAGIGHAVTVVGHPWLKPDQAYLMYSEAEQEADMQRALEAGRVEMLDSMRERFAAEDAQLDADLEEEARREHERVMWSALHPLPRFGLGGI
jgi:hypothetical protein